MSSEYVTPTELLGTGEPVEGIEVESSDYAPYELLDPGDGYISKQREVFVANKVSKRNQPFLSIEVRVSELENEAGETIQLERPLRTWINTLQFSRRNRPGTSSSAAEYLKEAGYDPKTLNAEQILEALQESTQTPLRVVIGWTNRTKKIAENEYTDEFARTRDFNVAPEGEPPQYVPSFEKDGETVLAKHRIVRFRSI